MGVIARFPGAPRSLLLLVALPTLLAPAADAQPASLEKATLTATVTSATCTLTSPSGSTTVPCGPGGWSPTLQDGWTATMTATVSWTYSDDGLPLSPLGYFDTLGGTSILATHEAGAIYARMPSCFPGSQTPCISGSGYPNAPYSFQLISNDTSPTSLSGSFDVTVTANHSFGPQWGAWTPSLYVNPDAVVFSSTAAIPEPSTWALMVLSLPVLGWAVRRRPAR